MRRCSAVDAEAGPSGSSSRPDDAWSVHDGASFAQHIRKLKPAAPNECRVFGLPTSKIIHLEELRGGLLEAALDRCSCSPSAASKPSQQPAPQQQPTSTRTETFAAMKKDRQQKRSLRQHRWTIHDGLFFAQHCRNREPAVSDEYIWLLLCGERPRSALASSRPPRLAAADAPHAPFAPPASPEADATSADTPAADAPAADGGPAVAAAEVTPNAQLPDVSGSADEQQQQQQQAAEGEEEQADLGCIDRLLLRYKASAEPEAALEADIAPLAGPAIGDAAIDPDAAPAVEVPAPDVLPEAVFSAACSSLDATFVRGWLHAGGDINAQESARGWTLLMSAAVYSHNLLVVELLHRGASTEVQQHTGSTALALAAMCGARRAVELLIQHGADVNSRDCMGGERVAASRGSKARGGDASHHLAARGLLPRSRAARSCLS